MADVRFASPVYLLVQVSTYCVPIALLRQNKPFRLLYLGYAQIKRILEIFPIIKNSHDLVNLKKDQVIIISMPESFLSKKSSTKNLY